MNSNSILTGERAVKLWSKGKEQWNAWVDSNNYWSIDFEEADFSEIFPERDTISFREFKFPVGTISFKKAQFGDRDVDFSHIDIKSKEIVFDEAEFGNGQLSFNDSTLTAKVISFKKVKFGSGSCSFINTGFRSGNVSFNYSEFGSSDISFIHSSFGVSETSQLEKEYVNESHAIRYLPQSFSFKRVCFGSGSTNFSYVGFADDAKLNFSGSSCGGRYFKCESTHFPKDTSFYRTRFECDDMIFDDSHFGSGIVDFGKMLFLGRRFRFSGATVGCEEFRFRDLHMTRARVSMMRCEFGRGLKDFSWSNFGKSDFSLQSTEFGDGDVLFNRTRFCGRSFNCSRAKFGKGSVNFGETFFSSEIINFKDSVWEGNLYFAPRYVKNAEKISFYNVIVDGEMAFGAVSTSCVIDLRHSKLSRSVDLDSVDIGFQKEQAFPKSRFFSFKKAKADEAATCFRRLKKLAKDADDHDSALEFFANEKRADYWRNVRGWWLAFYLFYDTFSEYGKSLARPLASLASLWLAFAVFYWLLGVKYTLCNFGAAVLFSLSHTIPIYFGARAAKDESLGVLFGESGPSMWLHGLGVFQEILCGIFLFMIALALRNRARS